VALRPLASASDPAFEGLLRIYRESIAPREQKPASLLRSMASRLDYRFLVLERRDKVAGFAIVHVSRPEGVALLEYMAVERGLRNRGMGADLFRGAVDRLRQERAGPLLLEVDSDEEASEDRKIRRRRQGFYRRLGCLRVAGCSYVLPLPGAVPPPAMDLLVHFGGPPPRLPRATLARWLGAVYRDVYGCSPVDQRIGKMLAFVPDPVRFA
jgi:GNAT superfamily N-acetyltransferase